jgi:hypothetical protein
MGQDKRKQLCGDLGGYLFGNACRAQIIARRKNKGASCWGQPPTSQLIIGNGGGLLAIDQISLANADGD